MSKPAVEDFGLLKPVYPSGVVKLPVQFLKRAKIPVICPNCLKPGTIKEKFTVVLSRTLGNQIQTQRIEIPISTHPECSRGFTKKNISGTVKIWGEGYPTVVDSSQNLFGFLMQSLGGGKVCFSFKDPWFSMLFIRLNFPVLMNERGEYLGALFDSTLRSFQGVNTSYYKKKCPRCGYGVQENIDECPSCGLNLAEGWDKSYRLALPDQEAAAVEGLDTLVGSVTRCPSCGIRMLRDKKVKKCGRCGAPLSIETNPGK